MINRRTFNSFIASIIPMSLLKGVDIWEHITINPSELQLVSNHDYFYSKYHNLWVPMFKCDPNESMKSLIEHDRINNLRNYEYTHYICGDLHGFVIMSNDCVERC
jgi:hypothetical protein